MQLQKELAPATAAGPVKSAARALDLLDEIAAHGPGTQLQLSTRLNIPKSSLHALLRTMVDRGWLQTDPTGSVYQLGIHSLVVSSAYLDGDPVLARVRELLAPGGRVLVGFEPVAVKANARSYPPAEFGADVEAAGLRVVHRFGSYELHEPHDEYAVWVLASA